MPWLNFVYRWPALILGIVIVTYWARVVRLTMKIRRSTGRSANFWPKERLGQALRFFWYPAVAVWTVQPFAAAFAAQPTFVFRPIVENAIVSWLAAAVAVAALAATVVCWKKMGKSWRMGINPGEKTELVVSGPYAFVRHPIYALSSLLMLSTLAIVPSPLMLVAGLIHLSLLQWEARREEQYLIEKHGDVYQSYCRQVGRFFPRSLKPFAQP